MNLQDEKIPVGGQAVIEGVMMRSPHAVSIAVRKPSGDILIKKEPFVPLTRKKKWLNIPILRGAIALIESIVLGIRALSFSGDVALEEENGETDGGSPKMSGLRMALLVVVSFVIGMFVFFYVPLLLTEWIGVKSGFWFNVIDGGFRLLIFLLYLVLITLMKDIRRLFQYHGAEHKSIFAFENKLELTVPNAQKFRTFHPRCGTSFLLIVMIVSVLVFLLLGKPHSIGDRLLRLLFVPVIGGVAYEFIRLSGKYAGNPFVDFLIAPGLWLQRITTKEPDDSQLEVALEALKSSLSEDFSEPLQVIKARNND